MDSSLTPSEAEILADEWISKAPDHTRDVEYWAFMAGYDSAARWRNSSKELPENRATVIMFHDTWGVVCGHFLEMPKMWLYDGTCYEFTKVRWWMPLPQPPRDDVFASGGSN